VPYFLLVFLTGLTGNLLGDVRGYEGDRTAGIRTIPVMFGTKTAKRIIHFNFGLFLLASLVSGCFLLAPMIPSMMATSLFLKRDDHKWRDRACCQPSSYWLRFGVDENIKRLKMCCITFNWEEGDALEKVRRFDQNKTVAWAVIEVTDFCNFNCAWCYAGAGYASGIRRHQMGKGELNTLVRKLAEEGVKQITYSGGEPTLFPEFAASLARLLRSEGIHVALETCGFFNLERLRPLLAELRLMLFDIKVFDGEHHRLLCGSDNTMIKENLRYLAESVTRGQGPAVWPRLPWCRG
jgi:uncharacterized Fe-S cluster-containing radical SAM superfamily protein